MGEPPGDPDEIQEIGRRLLDREGEDPPYSVTPAITGREIAELVADLEHAALNPRRVRLGLDDYRALHRDAEIARVQSDDLPEGVTVNSVEVVPDPDLDRGEGYAEVPVRNEEGF